MGSQEWAEAFKAAHGFYPWEDPDLLAKGASPQQALNEHLAAKKASEQPSFQGWEASYEQRHPAAQQRATQPVTSPGGQPGEVPPGYPGAAYPDMVAGAPGGNEQPGEVGVDGPPEGTPGEVPPVPLPKSATALYNPYGYAEANRAGGGWEYSGPKPSGYDPHSLTWQAPFDPGSEWWSWKQGGAPNPKWVADTSLFNPYGRQATTGGTWVYKGPRPPRSDPNYQTWRPVFDPNSQWWEFVKAGVPGGSDTGGEIPDLPQWRYR
jgi:hypothetical protein